MAIVSKAVYTRTNSSTPFITEANPPERLAYLAAYGNLAGTGIINEPVVVDDTLTITITCDSLESLSIEDNAGSVQYNNAVKMYNDANNIQFQNYTQTGIDSPFTMTTVYTASAPQDFTDLENLITRHSIKLTNISVTENTVTTVHTFDNSADFTANYHTDGFADLLYVDVLLEKGITRTVTFATV
jgi:hypothetical protein